jgi:PAT family beta-lactamase induction signal transducer AmpG
METVSEKSPWSWVPSLYFSQALPYFVVMTLSVVMYKNYGLSNEANAFYTSWLYLPWVIKPLWAPFVDMFRTKRYWIVTLQLLIGVALALVAMTTSLPYFIELSLAVFWLIAFSSATHDIAADGFYMLGLKQHQQAAFVGVRSIFFRLGMITVQGGLVYLAGRLTELNGNLQLAWTIVLCILGAMFAMLFVYHYVVLPKPAQDVAAPHSGQVIRDFLATFRAFFQQKDIATILAFLLLFRFGEAQLLKMAAPFLLDPVAKGGLGLTTAQYGLAYGTIGLCALILGGLLGGYAISRFGLKRCLWIMVLSVHLPDLVFVYLATALPQHLATITACIAIEQFGYGFGFAAYMLYMIMVADGPYKTSHYAICSGLMALGMMIPGLESGRIQEYLGYQHFFIWVCLATIPAFITAALVKIEPGFGKRR